MTEYDENWITTYTGLRFHYLSPNPNEINIMDIAHALSLKCRFSGHCKTFYSVGEHSVRVSELLPTKLKLSGLLHDATEAYIPDVPRPIKEAFGLRVFEDVILNIILDKYRAARSQQIKKADNILLATEARDLMPNTEGWASLPEPLPNVIVPWTPAKAEYLFLRRFYEYRGKSEQKI